MRVPLAGTLVNVNLTATHDNGTWIAHGATSADGTIEMRLTRTGTTATANSGPAGAFDFYVTGWISGVTNDPSGRSVVFSGQMSISGIVRPGTEVR